MAGLTAAQIVARACEIAKVPGFVQQGGQYLNMALAELCQTYNFQSARRTYYFNMNPGLTSLVGGYVAGSGPYDMPADYLRAQDGNAMFYYISGVPYRVTPVDLSEFNMLVQQLGLQAYPTLFAVDMSPLDAVQQGVDPGVPQGYLWPPPSGAFATTLLYYCQMPGIDTPETSAVVPWFPNQTYLVTRVAGELMRSTDDDRMAQFLGEGPDGAQGILKRYLKLVDDKQNRAETVKLDPVRFGRGTHNLPLSKFIGWGN